MMSNVGGTIMVPIGVKDIHELQKCNQVCIEKSMQCSDIYFFNVNKII